VIHLSVTELTCGREELFEREAGEEDFVVLVRTLLGDAPSWREGIEAYEIAGTPTSSGQALVGIDRRGGGRAEGDFEDACHTL